MNEAAARSRRFLLFLLVLAGLLLALIIAPFLGGLFTAAVFATVLHPLQRYLTAAWGGWAKTSAAAITLGLVLVVLAPLAWLTIVVVGQVVATTETVTSTFKREGPEGVLKTLPQSVVPLARRLVGMLPVAVAAEPVPDEPDREQMTEAARTGNTGAAAAGPGGNAEPGSPGGQPQAGQPTGTVDIGPWIAKAATFAKWLLVRLGGLAVETGVLIVALFFLLAQGTKLVQWVVATIPLPKPQSKQFFAEFEDVTVAVFLSTVTTAAIQTAIAAVGYLIARTPWFAVALLLTLVAAFIPAIGGASVVVIVGLLMWLGGETGWGIFLILWGVIPVGLCDNLAKPMLAQRRLHLPGPVVFFAMLGGLATLGPMGVVAGPLIVSFFLVVIRSMKTEQGVASP